MRLLSFIIHQTNWVQTLTQIWSSWDLLFITTPQIQEKKGLGTYLPIFLSNKIRVGIILFIIV